MGTCPHSQSRQPDAYAPKASTLSTSSRTPASCDSPQAVQEPLGAHSRRRWCCVGDAARPWLDATIILVLVLGSCGLGFLQVRVMIVLMLFVLIVNQWLGRPWIESMLFAVALAVAAWICCAPTRLGRSPKA